MSGRRVKPPVAPEPAPAPAEPGFEAAMARLEQIVAELEKGDLPLERSLALFEEGTALARSLDHTLGAAERRIEVLLAEQDGPDRTAPLAGPVEQE